MSRRGNYLLQSRLEPRNIQCIANRYTDYFIPARCNYNKSKTQPPLLVKQTGITLKDIDIAVREDLTETAYFWNHKIPYPIHSNSSMLKECCLLQCLKHMLPWHILLQYKQHAKTHLSVASTRVQDFQCRRSASSLYIYFCYACYCCCTRRDIRFLFRSLVDQHKLKLNFKVYHKLK
jgi:hypothetical protein